ncbi:hypothetical protein [Epibacterium sp. MM17-32]|uniref:hypothetical protein n=1 Tax=Epibacterium sp. MM17-32 TaxID=2917734 RepID=UPI001EF73A94|nr:hypothetical protein [Epibacterium sp. MM17-32]
MTILLAQLARQAPLDPRVLEAIEFLGFASAMTTLVIGVSTLPACLIFAVALWTGWGGWLTAVFGGMALGLAISWALFATQIAGLILIAAGAICGLISWLGARICAPDAFVFDHTS